MKPPYYATSLNFITEWWISLSNEPMCMFEHSKSWSKGLTKSGRRFEWIRIINKSISFNKQRDRSIWTRNY